jgi:hypothetical protein
MVFVAAAAKLTKKKDYFRRLSFFCKINTKTHPHPNLVQRSPMAVTRRRSCARKKKKKKNKEEAWGGLGLAWMTLKQHANPPQNEHGEKLQAGRDLDLA